MSKQDHDIIDLIENNPKDFEFKFSKYFERGIYICNQYATSYIIFFVFFMFITAIVGRIPTFGDAINRVFISPILMIGAHIVARNISQSREIDFDQFWKGIQYALPLIILTIIEYTAYLLILSPVILSSDFDLILTWFEEWQKYPLEIHSFPNFKSWYLFLSIPIIYLSISWIYAPLLVVFYQLSAWEALETSRKMVSKNWGIIAAFYFSVGLAAMSGALFFGIGILYSIPVAVCIFYASFEDIMNFYIEEEEEDLMKDLYDAF